MTARLRKIRLNELRIRKSLLVFIAVAFQPVWAQTAQNFVTVTPCRIADTRWATGPFGGPIMEAGETRTFSLPSSSCNIPTGATAYSLNVTVVVPSFQLGFLAMWPAGQPQPNVSTLNATGFVVANAAIVAAGTSGAINVYVSDPAHVILDIDGYFIPPGTGAAGNTAIGESALRSVTTGSQNTAIGFYSLPANTSGSTNVAIGDYALRDNTLGSENVAIGNLPMQNNTTGINNVAIGGIALTSNTSGSDNVAIGDTSMNRCVTGSLNTAIGAFSLNQVRNDSNNSSLGAFSLNKLVSGSSNTAVGGSSLENLLNGAQNIALGQNAGNSLTTGSYNLYIGNQGKSTESGVTRIGTIGQQNSVYIAGLRGVTTGNNDAIAVAIDSNGQLGTVSSSRRFKKDITDMGDLSSNLMQLRPVTYRYKQPFADGSEPIQYGLIAEEVADVYPELVAHSADGKIETVKYQMLGSMLLNEVQKQQKVIQSLESRVAALEQLIREQLDKTTAAR